MPLQRSALEAFDQLPSPSSAASLLFPAPEGGFLDLHNWRPRHWRPAQRAAAVTPTRRLYDLRHTFATVALRAGLGTFELSRYMGTSLINIDRTYGHLARDSHRHALELLDDYNSACGQVDAGGRFVDAEDRCSGRSPPQQILADSRKSLESPLPDSNRRPLPYHGGRIRPECPDLQRVRVAVEVENFADFAAFCQGCVPLVFLDRSAAREAALSAAAAGSPSIWNGASAGAE